jgi:PIN domain nuclease of toxin-antitoxin system
VWAVEEDRQLGRQAALQINAAAQEGGLGISAITPWEISMLVTKGRMTLSQEVGAWMRTVVSQPGLDLVPISPEIAIHAGQLPRSVHGDPADRLIIATALALKCPIMTVDSAILGYAASGHVKAVDARR